jgi:hypothetical protein
MVGAPPRHLGGRTGVPAGADAPRAPGGAARLARGSRRAAWAARALPGRGRPPASLLALAALAVVGLAAFVAFPTYPTYDSFYALVWGRDLLAGHAPDLSAYRAPTEHPLAIVFGVLCSLFGQAGARLMVAGAIASFVALVAGVFRVAQQSFGEAVGWVAAALMVTRFYDENLTVQGYLDITYLALVVWATALEVARPRRGAPVLWLLAAAGLLRPDAWVLSGVYWLWLAWPRRAPAWAQRVAEAPAQELPAAEGPAAEAAAGAQSAPPASNRARARWLSLALLAPVVWIAFDALLTGNPLHSLSATTELAGELERSHGLSGTLSSIWPFAVRIDKLPVLLGALCGAGLALLLVPRRALIPLAVVVLQVLVFVAEGVAGASVINRYLLGATALALVFCAFALGGWTVLQRSPLRLAWMAAALALVAYGAADVVRSFHPSELPRTMAYHEDFHLGLARALRAPAVRRALAACPVLSLPDNKLVPDARWILGSGARSAIVARSQARAEEGAGRPALARRLARGSVAVYPLGAAVFFEAIVDPGDDPRDQVPPPGFRRVYLSRYYSVYANC